MMPIRTMVLQQEFSSLDGDFRKRRCLLLLSISARRYPRRRKHSRWLRGIELEVYVDDHSKEISVHWMSFRSSHLR
jgi:hypothetical protein